MVFAKRPARIKKIVLAKQPGRGPGNKGKTRSKAGSSDQDRMARVVRAYAKEEKRELTKGAVQRRLGRSEPKAGSNHEICKGRP